MRNSTCALCLQTRELCRSHIVPKFAYRNIRKADGVEPVVIEEMRLAVRTSRQHTEYLLCTECERRFQVWEDYVAPLLRVQPGTESAILQGKREMINETCGIEIRDISGLDLRKLKLFGLSMLWRSHAARTVTNCDLGAKYSEQVRRHLLDPTNTSWPSGVVVLACCFEQESAPAALSWTGFSSRKAGYHWHRVCVSGLDFIIMVGGLIPPSVRQYALERGRILVTSDFSKVPGFENRHKIRMLGRLAAEDRKD